MDRVHLMSGVLALATTWGLTAGAACAEELQALEVARRYGEYRIHADAILDAPADRVLVLLTDYAGLGRLNPAIRRAERLPDPRPGVARVRTVVESCVLLFCRELVRVEDVHAVGPGRLQATILPGAGDFESGVTLWRLLALEDGRCRLVYQSRLRPAFWVPPLIGPAMIRRSVDRGLRTTLHNLERLASPTAARVQGHD